MSIGEVTVSRVFVALCSNLGLRRKNIARSIEAIRNSPLVLGVVGCSDIFETEALVIEEGNLVGQIPEGRGKMGSSQPGLGKVIDETCPFELRRPVERKKYLNAVVEFHTVSSPQALLLELQRLEGEIGRDRSLEEIRYCPRVIDLDILFFGDIEVNLPDLEIPHPRLHERRFVLEPLSQLDSNFIHPTLKKTVRELLENLKDDLTVDRYCAFGEL